MENSTTLAIPQQALRRLEFLSGEYEGQQTLFLTKEAPVTYGAHCTVSREACERFLKVEFFAEVPDLGIETWTAFATYSTRKGFYEMWLFSSSSEEPLHMTGDFVGNHLVMVSDPWSMPWGLQRLRATFTPHADGSFEYGSEMWEPDGYTKFRHTVFRRRPLDD